MRRPAVFFDRDNTLIVGNDYLGDPAGVVLVAGAPAAVALCRELGYAVVVVSNQSGVARGMFTEDAVAAVNRAMDEQLLAANPNAVIDRHEYCPHHPQGTAEGYAIDCDCRKPKPGMVLRAAEAMALDLANSWMVGDAPRDVEAGQAAGCRTILIIDNTLAPSPAAKATLERPADFVVGSLIEAIDVILQDSNRRRHSAEPAASPAEEPREPVAASVTEREPTSEPVQPEPAPLHAAPPQAVPAAVPATAAPPVVALPPTPQPPVVVTQPAAPKIDLSRLETTSQQILMELKKLNDVRNDDFSISKLIAGITQTLALAAMPLAYVLYRGDANVFQAWLLTAIFLQAFTVALLMMGRQR